MHCEQHLIVQPGCLACEVMKLEATVDVLWKLPGTSHLEGQVAMLRGYIEALGRTVEAHRRADSALEARVKKIEERFELEDKLAREYMQPASALAPRVFGEPLLRRFWRVMAYELEMQKAQQQMAERALFPTPDPDLYRRIFASELTTPTCDKCGKTIQRETWMILRPKVCADCRPAPPPLPQL